MHARHRKHDERTRRSISLGKLRDILRSDLSQKERIAFHMLAPPILEQCVHHWPKDVASPNYGLFMRTVLPPGQVTLKMFANLVTMLARMKNISSNSWKEIHDFLVGECDL